MASTADPALPLGGALVYCIWRLFSKRKARSPEGPYWGNSPVWGALFTALLGLFAGSAVTPPPPLPIPPPPNPASFAPVHPLPLGSSFRTARDKLHVNWKGSV